MANFCHRHEAGRGAFSEYPRPPGMLRREAPDGQSLAFAPTGVDGADSDSILLSGRHGHVMLMWSAFDGAKASPRPGT